MFKGITPQLTYMMRGRTSKQNLGLLAKLLLMLFGKVAILRLMSLGHMKSLLLQKR